ncbi:MAG: flagellar basal body rod C-terminal domain-containing protein [Caulobacter sp.]|jgi:flagellar hook protein FlgE
MRITPIATAGLMSAAQRLDQSAQRTALWGTEGSRVNLPVEAVEQISAKTAFKANAAVIRTADRMTGTLLDILA